MDTLTRPPQERSGSLRALSLRALCICAMVITGACNRASGDDDGGLDDGGVADGFIGDAMAPPECGDGVLQVGEACEPGAFDAPCGDYLPGVDGMARCTAECTLDLTACERDGIPPDEPAERLTTREICVP